MPCSARDLATELIPKKIPLCVLCVFVVYLHLLPGLFNLKFNILCD